MSRDGTTTPLRTDHRNWLNPAFSPDGRRLALEVRNGQSDVWILDLSTGALVPLTSGPSQDSMPVWTPDGEGIVFASDRDGSSALNLFLQRADGTGGAQRLTRSRNVQRPSSWSGNSLLFTEESTAGSIDVMRLRVDGTGKSGWTPGEPAPFLNESFFETGAMVSPDGRWVAYVSRESGRGEVYVRPFPGPGAKSTISNGGGWHPAWSTATNELFFDQKGQIMVARYRATKDSFQAGKAQLWSEARYTTRGGPNRMFALDPNAPRFAVAPATVGPVGANLEKVVLFVNFFEELRRLAPPTRQ
jgi:Tol biopolymer transport system component